MDLKDLVIFDTLKFIGVVILVILFILGFIVILFEILSFIFI